METGKQFRKTESISIAMANIFYIDAHWGKGIKPVNPVNLYFFSNLLSVVSVGENYLGMSSTVVKLENVS